MLNLLLAYAYPDSAFAARLRTALEQRGYEVWDWYENLPGSDWGRVFSAIESSSAFLFILTPKAIASQACLQELQFAVEQGKAILPLLRENVPGESLPESLRDRQWLMVLDDRDLESAVDTVAGVLGTNPSLERQKRLLLQALQWQRTNKDKSFLLSGLALKEAQELIGTTNRSEQATVVLDFVEKSERQERLKPLITSGVIVVTLVFFCGALYVRSKNLPAAAGLGFAGGVCLTLLTLKLMGFTRPRQSIVSSQKSTADPDPLGPETVFLSDGRRDWDQYARATVEHLRAGSLTVWVDQSFIQGGDDWMDAIQIALQTCRRMVLSVTPSALESKYVKKEYRSFIDQNKADIPCHL